jgi:hypothetical protein
MRLDFWKLKLIPGNGEINTQIILMMGLMPYNRRRD